MSCSCCLPSTYFAVSQLPVVRFEHVRSLFDSTQSQKSKSGISLRKRMRQCALGPILRPNLYLWFPDMENLAKPAILSQDSFWSKEVWQTEIVCLSVVCSVTSQKDSQKWVKMVKNQTDRNWPSFYRKTGLPEFPHMVTCFILTRY